MLASYFYQGDVPEPEILIDMARQALVSETSSADDGLDSDVCEMLLDGLAKAWTAARIHARRQDEKDIEERCFDTAAQAEQTWHETFLRTYRATIARTYPSYKPSGEEATWPEGLKYRDGWPKTFIAKLAATLGEIEGDRSVAMWEYVQKLDAEKAAGGEA